MLTTPSKKLTTTDTRKMQKMNRFALLTLIVCLFLGDNPAPCFSAENHPAGYVVLVHGLGRTSKSFLKMERHLEQNGYDVLNIDYPSRKYDIETLSAKFVRPTIEKYCTNKNRKIHFVTHSMGAIIVRHLLQAYPMDNLGRIVMLSPPNSGSEVVDFLKERDLIQKIMGPAFSQLSTDPKGFINTLGNVNTEVGVITGNQSINWINSLIIPGEDDGKVAVDRTRLKTMQDFMVVQRTHTFIMNADEVLHAVVQFIKTGRFHAAN